MNNNKTYIPASIDGFEVYSGIVAGVKNLLEYQDKLDEINVFPVPDGDTGTNMCFTLLPIIEECKDQISENVSEVFDIMADIALESARGNSGTIIAQYFHVMRKACQNKDLLYLKDFTAALEHGYKSAKDSLLNPKEGTIITVMREVSEKATDLLSLPLRKDDISITGIFSKSNSLASAYASKILSSTSVFSKASLILPNNFSSTSVLSRSFLIAVFAFTFLAIIL